MQDDVSEKNKSSGFKKYWLRIVIILAIGIPVLLELNTLYNLVKVHVFGKEETAESRITRTVEDGREITIGDTLYSSTSHTVIIHDMRVSVSPNRWKFILTLAADSEPGAAFRVRLDSVWLDDGRGLPGKDPSGWQAAEDSIRWESTQTWDISNGDIPERLSVVFVHSVSEDSVKRNRETFNLGSIPVRYRE